MSTNTILVVGGNGIIGRNATDYLQSTGNWNVLVTSRRSWTMIPQPSTCN
ncbi:NAD-dependent epimerase/dehydratase family protein [Hymenobacter sp. AT01-02]|nr:NAD-dependent epimerase/dehydratase family protein [Hymenobacter sp. AT01-02]